MLHVLINTGPHQSWPVTNLTEDVVHARFVEPWLQGEPVVARGKHFNAGQYWLSIYEGDEMAAKVNDIELFVEIQHNRREVTDNFITKPFGAEKPKPKSKSGAPIAADPSKVMVIHGRDTRLRKSMFEFLRSIGLHPLEWSEIVGSLAVGSPFVGQILDEAFATAQAAVVLSSPDDLARLSESLVPKDDPENEAVVLGQSRPNVFLEAGMSLVSFPSRTILTQCGRLRPASDLLGRHVVHLNNGPECRQALAQRLESAGCPVNRAGTDWLTAGDFQPTSFDKNDFQAGDENDQGQRKAHQLLARIRTLRADLGDEDGYVIWSVAVLYNELVEQSDVSGIPTATHQGSEEFHLSQDQPYSEMSVGEMRTFLNQMLVQLGAEVE